MTLFGPAGIPLACDKCDNVKGINHSISLGLKAYEIEFVRGVKISQSSVNLINDLKINLSCHAPYYINCNNKLKYETTKRNILNCARTGLNLKVIVFHTGYLMGMPRSQALRNSIKTIKRLVSDAQTEGLKLPLGPEIAGKHSQIGTMSDIITICKEVRECKPVIDWAHLHATTHLKNYYDFMKPLEQLSDELGSNYLKSLHCHFSEIEYSDKGEVRHQPLGSGYGPDFKILAKVINDNNFNFTIISESPLIERDALKMKSIIKKSLINK